MKTPPLLIAAGLALAATAVLPAVAPAAQHTITLKSEHVDAMGATVLAAPNGRTLYRLSPETTKHLLCTSSSCLGLWHPLTVKSKGTVVHLATGAKGSPGLMRRGKAYQVTLGGKPLYTFTGDTATGQATGDTLKSFGGTWHVFALAKDAAAPAPAPTPAPSPGYGGY